jgi:hypothetical protein
LQEVFEVKEGANRKPSAFKPAPADYEYMDLLSEKEAS